MSQVPLRSSDYEDRRSYLHENRFEAGFGGLALLSAIQFYLDPTSFQRTAVGMALHGPLDDIWSLMYGFGGLAIIVGIVTRYIAIEAAGLWLLGSATVVNMYGICLVRGGAVFTVLTPFVLTVILCMLRLGDLRRVAKYGQSSR